MKKLLNDALVEMTQEEIDRMRKVYPRAASEQEALLSFARLRLAPMLATLSADDTLSVEPLIEPWAPAAYKTGDVRTCGGNVWRCGQAHDSTINKDVIPGEIGGRAFWFPYHAHDPRYAKLFIQPTCREDAYMSGECCIFSDRLYICQRDYTDRSPAELPDAWSMK